MANPLGRKAKTASFGVAEIAGQTTCPRCSGTGRVTAEGISIGDRIRSLRMGAGKTQAELAPSLKISRAQLANLEGDRSRPGLETLVLAADALHVSVDHLLGRV